MSQTTTTTTTAASAPAAAATRPAARLGLKERYGMMTRDLGWETTYQSMDDVFPFDQFEGIKIHDWDKWEDPFRLTMDAYWKYQGEKERKLYAIIDAFQQNSGQFQVTDARYVQALKVFINGITANWPSFNPPPKSSAG